MTNSEIVIALFSHVQSSPDLPQVVFPNTEKFANIRKTDSNFIECYILPRQTESRGLNSVNDEGGILQFNIYVGIGSSIECIRIADRLIELYKRGVEFGKLRIDKRGWTGPALSDAGRYVQPVSIPYRIIN